MLSSRRELVWMAASALTLPRLRAQQPPTFSTDIKVVGVFATVHDKDGKIVRSLTKDDFTLLEDGRPQTIRYFTQQSDIPLTLGLLVDTSGSERRMIPAEREASSAFFDKVLRPDRDKAFLIHFDRDVELLQDLTSSRERLQKALALLQTSEPDPNAGGSDPGGGNTGGGNSPGGSGGGGWPGSAGGGGWGGRGGGQRGGGHRMHGGTAFYDAVYLAANEVLKDQSGRKAVIMLTDGEDNASKITMAEAIGSAERADTLAYSVRIADTEQGMVRGFGGPGMGRRGAGGGANSERPDGKKVLRQISSETGGAYFEVSKKKPVDQIYTEIEEELRNQYSLGYTSDRPDSETGYRKIALTVKQKGLTVQARDGYYPGVIPKPT